MSDSDEIIVQLKILSSSWTPEQLDEAIGLSSDESWHIGDGIPRTILVAKTHGWIVGSQMSRSVPMKIQVRKLLDRLFPYRDRIYQVSQRETVILLCVVYSNRRPELVFAKEDIQKIAELGATLDIDVYILD